MYFAAFAAGYQFSDHDGRINNHIYFKTDMPHYPPIMSMWYVPFFVQSPDRSTMWVHVTNVRGYFDATCAKHFVIVCVTFDLTSEIKALAAKGTFRIDPNTPWKLGECDRW